jgi:class 3 adenylate cyclase
MPEPDRVLATVLFTDIVGSTDLAARLGDKRWHALLERHHRLVREQLPRFRGREIDTAGDGFYDRIVCPARNAFTIQAVLGQLTIKRQMDS